jgi:rod shape-determining protein MreD
MMGFLSIQLRTRLWQISLATVIVLIIWLIQTDLITRFSLKGLLCNLPLTFTILWGAVFGSKQRGLVAEELRSFSVGEIAAQQALSGSASGACVGGLFAALYGSALPIYPIAYPLIGWISGYFSLQKVNQPAFLSIPLVLFASVFAEFVTGCQLTLMNRPDTFARFVQIAMPESILNALVAPIIFIPMRTWYEFWTSREVSVSE